MKLGLLLGLWMPSSSDSIHETERACNLCSSDGQHVVDVLSGVRVLT
jgi:hypothetical protein